MKWMPFTPASRQQLMEDGYTFVIIKKKVVSTQLWLNNRKDLQFLEASKSEHTAQNEHCEPISSPEISNFFDNERTDYYIVVR